jgi:hypothetical protein
MMEFEIGAIAVLCTIGGFVAGRAYGMELVIRRILKAHYDQ